VDVVVQVSRVALSLVLRMVILDPERHSLMAGQMAVRERSYSGRSGWSCSLWHDFGRKT